MNDPIPSLGETQRLRAALAAAMAHLEQTGQATSPLYAQCASAVASDVDAQDEDSGFHDFSATAEPAASIQWPKARDVGRLGDMSPIASLRVGFDGDNDVSVSVWDERGGATLEFCTPGSGGGKSSRTRVALIGLMVAMEADNAQDPHRDWWALRNGTADLVPLHGY